MRQHLHRHVELQRLGIAPSEAVVLIEVFERSLDVLGAERILYGSDSSFFPRGWQKDQIQTQVGVLEEVGVTRDQAAGILRGNLTRLAS